MDFGSGNTSSISSSQKQDVIDKVKQQIAVATAQELIQKMSEKCFKKCITKPGASLDNYDQKCIAMCMDRFMDSWNLVSKTYSSRLKKNMEVMNDIFILENYLNFKDVCVMISCYAFASYIFKCSNHEIFNKHLCMSCLTDFLFKYEKLVLIR